jgi:hypothetical protein
MIEEVMLDRQILEQLDRYDISLGWDDEMPDLDTEWAVEQLSQEALLLLS